MTRSMTSATAASKALLVRPLTRAVNRIRRAGPRFLLAMAIIAYLISAVLQYLITFGFPKYKEMIFYRFDINTWQSFRLSMWDVCVGQPGKRTFAPSTMADMGQPEVFQCQETSIGWSGSPVTQELFSSTLSHALVLHPFALYFSVVGIFFSLAAWTNERLTLWPLAAAPIPLLAMLVDTSLIASAFYHLVDHEKTRQYLGGVVTMQKLGLASWLSVASAVVSLLGGWLVFLAFWERVKVDGGASVESGVGRWFLRRPQDGAFDLPLVNSGSNSAMTPVSSSTPTTDSSQMLLGVASLSGDEKDKFSSLSPSPEIEEGYTHSFSAFALQQQQHLHSAQQLQMQDFKLSGGEEDFTCPSSRVSSIGGGHRSSDSSASGSGGSSSGTASRSVSPLGGSPR